MNENKNDDDVTHIVKAIDKLSLVAAVGIIVALFVLWMMID